jgi:uncharacterized repeat protein (TIGR03837 family)
MLWDIFCRVIDNYGDIGVSWRLSADLAARGHSVRLWVDDAAALQWMAPGALQEQWPGVQVRPWNASTRHEQLQDLPQAEVWIESFGCDIPQPFVAHFAQRAQPAPVWINLEYLSAEAYVERSHGLPSPVLQGPAKGWTKTFFYPGFTQKTGGLLRGPQEASDTSEATSALRISLFCYEPPLLQSLLKQLSAWSAPVHLLVTPGRAAAAVRQLQGKRLAHGALQLHYLPALSQIAYDQLLHSCDINFVRGEDSVVRAIWAGEPFVWHIYAQEDLAHGAKLEAFLQQLQLGPAACALHRAWNGLAPGPENDTALLPLEPIAFAQWQAEVRSARSRLRTLPDLSSQLCDFVLKNR